MLILASASPRRKELLSLIDEDLRVITSDVDETPPPDSSPRGTVEELALRKARKVAESYRQDVVIGADTIVVVGGDILGKPENEEQAAKMLKRLSGRQHSVYTGVAIMSPKGSQVFSEKTYVHFIPLTDEMIKEYIATGEPLDKAGAYGIQGRGALFVSKIEGDFANVVGLPICRLSLALRKLLR